MSDLYHLKGERATKGAYTIKYCRVAGSSKGALTIEHLYNLKGAGTS